MTVESPSNWTKSRLKELVFHRSGDSSLIKGKLYQEPSEDLYPAYSASGQDVWHTSYHYDQTGIVISAVGARCGKAFLAEGKWVAIANTHVVFPDERIIDAKFLWYLLNDENFWIKGGTGQPFVRVKQSFEQTFLLPPIGEQRRIVAKLEELFSELDDSVANLETARARLQTYRQSLLKHAFEGRLTEQWRRNHADELESADQLLERIREERQARYQQQLEDWKAQVAQWEADGKPGKKPRKPKESKELPAFEAKELDVLPSVPESWNFVRLGTIAEIGSGMAVSKSRKLEDPVEVPYLRVANVQRGKLVLDEVKTMEVERSELEALKLRKWDVLFNEGGDRDKLGRGWIWESEIDPCITQNHVFRARPWLDDDCHSKFISYWGNAFGRDYFEKAGKQTTNLASINKTVLSMFPVPIPPLEEQREIVWLLEGAATRVDALEKEISEALEREQVLRRSILKRAFEGRLVPQDPNDEPASELLARIRGEAQSGQEARDLA